MYLKSDILFYVFHVVCGLHYDSADSRRACNHRRGGSRLPSPDHLPGSGRGSVACHFPCRSADLLSQLDPVVVRSTVLAWCSCWAGCIHIALMCMWGSNECRKHMINYSSTSITFRRISSVRTCSIVSSRILFRQLLAKVPQNTSQLAGKLESKARAFTSLSKLIPWKESSPREEITPGWRCYCGKLPDLSLSSLY